MCGPQYYGLGIFFEHIECKFQAHEACGLNCSINILTEFLFMLKKILV